MVDRYRNAFLIVAPAPYRLRALLVSAPMLTPTPRLRGRAAVEQRKRRMARTHGYCERCEAKGVYGVKATVVDHTIPLAKGGPDTDDNTRNLCPDCDREVTAEQFGYRKRQAIGPDGWPTG